MIPSMKDATSTDEATPPLPLVPVMLLLLLNEVEEGTSLRQNEDEGEEEETVGRRKADAALGRREKVVVELVRSACAATRANLIV